MKKDNKGNIIIAVVVSVLLIALVIVIVLTLNKKNKHTDNPGENEITGEQTETGNLSELESYVAECQKVTEEEGYKQTYIYHLKVEKDRLTSSLSSVKLEYNDEEMYNAAKENDYGKKMEFDDSTKTIEYIDTLEETDFTKDADGNEVNQSYTTYKEALEKNGYTCTEVNE